MAKFNETQELLVQLIKNKCVNDGTVTSGQEHKNSDLLESFIETPGIKVDTFESEPGRKSLVARIEGTNPEAPSLCLMGHTDVVPVTPDGWKHDPFGGELIDGEIWGRGAIDMLNLTASMAVAFRQIAQSDTKPVGDLVYFAVADEEAGGTYGAKYAVENHWDLIAADCVLTEYGGIQSTNETGSYVLVNAGEKGVDWRRLTIKGKPGHGSRPYGADNALIKAAEVVRRLSSYSPNPVLSEQWKRRIDSLELPAELRNRLNSEAALNEALADLPAGDGAFLHACSHTTFSPNVIHGGTKTNTICDHVELHVDIRCLPGETSQDVDSHLKMALGNLYEDVVVEKFLATPDDIELGSSSDVKGKLWDSLEMAVRKAEPEAQIVPGLITGGTDARFYRKMGSQVLGAGLLNKSVDTSEFYSRFHGNNERIDLQSLDLATQLWLDIVDSFNQG